MLRVSHEKESKRFLQSLSEQPLNCPDEITFEANSRPLLHSSS
jgi:hypothetical protein